MPTLDRHVFIVTYGRSGSTLLQNVLNSIPGYCIRGENNNALYHMARAWEAVAGSEQMRGERIRGEGTGRDHPWFGAELVDPDTLGASLAESFTQQVLRPEPGTRVTGFKEIRFHLTGAHGETYLDFIQRFFPDARFIFNTRDHDGVAKSGWWASMNPAMVKAELEKAEARFKRMQTQLGERAFAVHYDDFAGTPKAFKPLFDFLGEPFDLKAVEEVASRRLKHTGTRQVMAVAEDADE